ncbi:hypothetical protein HF313_18255 [Massilia atriviolacea]|uniref:NIPSNAP family protein n=1 Tax=Massilia atriviolacea TaxID=2495579 RepID=A0A430HTR2_9BURK|nr:NIPSNAP family protein [Massilia atriviolacea]RSZ60774.1 hypothetical protein EJB06_01135 [Massilia atriviolacea]
MNTVVSNDACPVIELRRYTAAREERAELARRFDEAFAPAFEQLGGVAIGHFCERDRPDGVAWLRGFRSGAARSAIGRAFDAQARLPAAGDAVLLLRALHPGSGLALPTLASDAQGIVVAHILHVRQGLLAACARAAEARFAAYHGRGVIEAGILATHDGQPGAPGAALVWLGVVRDDAALADLRPALDGAAAALAARGLLAAPAEVLVLDPCRHARLRWISAASVTAPAYACTRAAA